MRTFCEERCFWAMFMRLKWKSPCSCSGLMRMAPTPSAPAGGDVPVHLLAAVVGGCVMLC